MKVHIVTLIALIVGIVIIIFIAINMNVGSYSAGSQQTYSTAQKLGNAFTEISNCIETQGSNCVKTIKVKVMLPQADVDRGGWFSTRDYPLWTIFHNTELNGTGHNTDANPNTRQEAPTIEQECDKLWSKFDRNPKYCTNGLCYGLIGRADFGSVPLEDEVIRKIKPFWIASPCYAEVVVKPSAGANEGCVNCIEICYMIGKRHIPKKEWIGKENFCRGDDIAAEWPDDADAWDNTLPNHQHLCP